MTSLQAENCARALLSAAECRTGNNAAVLRHFAAELAAGRAPNPVCPIGHIVRGVRETYEAGTSLALDRHVQALRALEALA